MSISSPPCLKSKAPHLYVSRPPPCCIPPQREFTCVGLREGRQAPPSMASFQAPGSGTRSRTLPWRLWETAMWLSCLHNRERALFFFFFSYLPSIWCEHYDCHMYFFLFLEGKPLPLHCRRRKVPIQESAFLSRRGRVARWPRHSILMLAMLNCVSTAIYAGAYKRTTLWRPQDPQG